MQSSQGPGDGRGLAQAAQGAVPRYSAQGGPLPDLHRGPTARQGPHRGVGESDERLRRRISPHQHLTLF